MPSRSTGPKFFWPRTELQREQSSRENALLAAVSSGEKRRQAFTLAPTAKTTALHSLFRICSSYYRVWMESEVIVHNRKRELVIKIATCLALPANPGGLYRRPSYYWSPEMAANRAVVSTQCWWLVKQHAGPQLPRNKPFYGCSALFPFTILLLASFGSYSLQSPNIFPR